MLSRERLETIASQNTQFWSIPDSVVQSHLEALDEIDRLKKKLDSVYVEVECEECGAWVSMVPDEK